MRHRLLPGDRGFPSDGFATLGGGGGYFMLGALDGVVIEVFEPGPLREPVVREYYGFGG